MRIPGRSVNFIKPQFASDDPRIIAGKLPAYYFLRGIYKSVIVPSNTSAAMPTDSPKVGCG